MSHGRQRNQINKCESSPPPPTIQPLLVSVDEAATALRLGRTKIYSLMKAGALSYVKIGKRRLIPVSGLKTLVDHLSDSGVNE